MPSSDALCASSGAADQVADREHAGHGACALRASTSTKPRLVDVHARGLEPEVGRERPAPDRDEQLIGLDLLGALLARRATTRTPSPFDLHALEARAEPHLDALAPELALRAPAASSGSAPGSICDAISSTVTLAPYMA